MYNRRSSMGMTVLAEIRSGSDNSAGVRKNSWVENFLHRRITSKKTKKQPPRNQKIISNVLFLQKSPRSTTKPALKSSETSSLSNFDWLSTSLTSSALQIYQAFALRLAGKDFHTSLHALQVHPVDQTKKCLLWKSTAHISAWQMFPRPDLLLMVTLTPQCQAKDAGCFALFFLCESLVISRLH